MFEVIAILFVILGVVSSILQSSQKGKRPNTGFPQPMRSDISKAEVDDVRTTKTKSISRTGVYKVVSQETEQSQPFPMTESIPIESRPILPAYQIAKTDSSLQPEVSITNESVLNGIIFSAILSPPKCRGKGVLP